MKGVPFNSFKDAVFISHIVIWTRFFLGYLQHKADYWWSFQKGSTSRQIGALLACHGPFSVKDREPINKPMEDHVVEVHKDADRALDI
ncbi:hypothetical protein CFAM422_011199 [Trichoderma lentiforme]|uniref:Uncharacterized protein n=1 Tax=Trichoderma lentiforme TaxID=1567552 RepID=A0A9P4X773_9HYPO|nr:hypothetical protein CFAM422_011199 [Trichoderma lentiforme]